MLLWQLKTILEPIFTCHTKSNLVSDVCYITSAAIPNPNPPQLLVAGQPNNAINRYLFSQKRKEHLETFDADQLRDVTDALIRSVRDTPEEEKERVGLTDEHILITVQVSGAVP